MGQITHGVPQGSILGPLLFILYINDIANASPCLTFYLFADDTTIFHSDSNIKTLESTLNHELIKVSQWLIANKLSLNIKKSNVLLFRTKTDTNKAKICITLNGQEIEEKASAKYLGMILDNKLTFEKHIQHVRSKLIKGNVILAKVRHFVPSNILLNMYNAHIQPHIDYGFLIWGYAPKTHLNTVITQQKKKKIYKNS